MSVFDSELSLAMLTAEINRIFSRDSLGSLRLVQPDLCLSTCLALIGADAALALHVQPASALK